MATQAKRFQEMDAGATLVDEKTSATQPSSTNEHSNELYFEKKSAEGKIELTEDAAPDCTGFSFSSKKKWSILTVIVVVQYSMNYNAASGLCCFNSILSNYYSLCKRSRWYDRRVGHFLTSS